MTQLLPQTTKVNQRANTLANCVLDYLNTNFKGRSRSYVDKQRLVLEEFEIFIKDRPIDRITLAKWNEAQEKRGCSPATINKKNTLLRQFFRWCEYHEYIERSPDKFLIRHHVTPSPLPSLYTEAEYERIKQATKGTDLYYLTIVAARTGMSMVDCIYLRWPCVDLEQLYIQTNRIKTSWRGAEASMFWVPILANSDLHLLLKELKAAHKIRFNNANDEYVHPELVGEYQLARFRFCKRYADLLKKLGIKGKTFKNWRNTFISNVANSGANMAVAMKLTGHKDPTVYAQYIKPDVESLRNILQKAMQWSSEKETIKQLRTPEP